MIKMRLFGVLVVCAAQTACVVVDGSPGGERTTRTSEPDDFDRLAVTGGFKHVDVRVCGDCAPRVKITGDDRQVDDIIVVVNDGELELRHRNRLVVTDIDLEAVVRVPNLVALVQSGSADVSVTGIASEDFDLVSSGSGDVEIEGIADALDATSSGSGDIAAYDLEANRVDITLSGSGDAQVCARDSLRARTTGSGDVFYDCKPETTDFNATGSGSISIR